MVETVEKGEVTIVKIIGICGHFGGGHTFLDGQTVKTKNLANELERIYGENEVMKVDTYGGVKHFPILIIKLVKLLFCCQNVIVLPAQNGLRVVATLYAYLNLMLHRKLHYVVIGGWLPEFLADKNRLIKQLKKFSGIYVETITMKNALESIGFLNIFVMPNFKNIHILDKDELVYSKCEPYQLCTFSRVMKEKGIEDAIKAVTNINKANNRTVYELDIYGQIAPDQESWFESLQANFPSYIRYRGLVDHNQSVNVVKEYFALLFPTHFFTEGIPGTILDAYAAGVPIISSRWESFHDIIDDGKTGIGYEFSNTEELTSLLANFAEHPRDILALKNNCLEKAKSYLPKNVVNVISRNLDI